MKKWKAWEAETTSLEYEFTNGNYFFQGILFIYKEVSYKIDSYKILYSIKINLVFS